MNENDNGPATANLVSALKSACSATLPPHRRAEISRALLKVANQQPVDGRHAARTVAPRVPWLVAALRRHHRIGVAGIACVIVALSGLTIALGATPGVRSALGLSSGSPTLETLPNGAGLVGQYPGVPGVVNPGYIPDGLTSREFAYYPARSTTMRGTRATILGYDRKSYGTGGGESILATEGVPGVYEGFFSPDGTRYVELLEQAPVSGSSLTLGQSVTVSGAAATIHREGAITVVQLIKANTLVRVRTSLGDSQALKVAAGLRPL